MGLTVSVGKWELSVVHTQSNIDIIIDTENCGLDIIKSTETFYT